MLLSIDSLRPDHLSAHGRANAVEPGAPSSPGFDAFARGGVRFEQAVSTTSWTLPAHVALLTGLPDLLHGVTDNFKRLGDGHVTLAELFRDAGYRTAGFFSGPNLHPAFGFGQGFEAYEDRSRLDVAAARFEGRELGDLRDVHLASHRAVTSPALLEGASAFLRAAAGEGRPFFLFVHWWDPHYDYLAPEEIARRFVDPAYRGDVSGAHAVDKTKAVGAEDVRHLRELYDAEVRFTDDHVARLLGVLDELGLADDTLVVWTADHGEEFYERGRWGHQRTLYDEVVRIPLALRWPGVLPAGVVATGQARLYDVYATLADLCDLPAPPWVEGASLRPLWEDPAHPGFAAPLALEVPKPTNPVREVGL
ncbi:MAG TPA: sulfatase, partial [Planctomycetota bacterium]|nr:sulfatase [Planctomycetota bacterium]